MKCYSVNKTRIPANNTSSHTTSNFTTITCVFTRTTSTSMEIQYGKFNEVAFVKRLGK